MGHQVSTSSIPNSISSSSSSLDSTPSLGAPASSSSSSSEFKILQAIQQGITFNFSSSSYFIPPANPAQQALAQIASSTINTAAASNSIPSFPPSPLSSNSNVPSSAPSPLLSSLPVPASSSNPSTNMSAAGIGASSIQPGISAATAAMNDEKGMIQVIDTSSALLNFSVFIKHDMTNLGSNRFMKTFKCKEIVQSSPSATSSLLGSIPWTQSQQQQPSSSQQQQSRSKEALVVVKVYQGNFPSHMPASLSNSLSKHTSYSPALLTSSKQAKQKIMNLTKNETETPLQEFERHWKRLEYVRSVFNLQDHPNVVPYQRFFAVPTSAVSTPTNNLAIARTVSDIAANPDVTVFLVRQYFSNSLYDRIGTRPSLTEIEKIWISYQLLRALEQSHNAGVAHGDIKSENIMMTSWGWVFLTDFGSFKPTFLPPDQPAAVFDYFFAPRNGTNACYLAPERFCLDENQPSSVSSSSSQAAAMRISGIKHDGKELLRSLQDPNLSAADTDRVLAALAHVDPIEDLDDSVNGWSRSMNNNLEKSMDIFSLGCVIGELFRDGARLFSLSDMLKFAATPVNSQTSVEIIESVLSDKQIPDQVRNLVRDMLQRDPRKRKTASWYLEEFKGKLFPESFSNFLEPFLKNMIQGDLGTPDARIWKICSSYAEIIYYCTNGKESDDVGAQFFKSFYNNHFSQTSNQINENFNPREKEDVTKNKQIIKSDTTSKFLDSFVRLLQGENSPEIDSLIQSIRSSRDVQNRLNPLQQQQLLLQQPQHQQGIKHSEEDNIFILDEYPAWRSDTECDYGFILLMDVIFSSLRHIHQPHTKQVALWLLLRFSAFSSDDVRLQLVIPYIVSVLNDSSPLVCCTALRVLVRILALVKSISQADALLIPDYIFPAIRKFADDPSETTRLVFAECLPHFAEASKRFLELSTSSNASAPSEAQLRPHSIGSTTSLSSYASSTGSVNPISPALHAADAAPSPLPIIEHHLPSQSIQQIRYSTPIPQQMRLILEQYDKKLNDLHSFMKNHLSKMSSDKDASTATKMNIVAGMYKLCKFFGIERTDDFLLGFFITFLNRGPNHWRLHVEVLEAFPLVSKFVGTDSLERYLFPLIKDCLVGPEIVIERALRCSGTLVKLGLLGQQYLIELVENTAKFVLFPSTWVREAAYRLLARVICAEQMGGPPQVQICIIPLIKKFFKPSMGGPSSISLFLGSIDSVIKTEKLLKLMMMSPIARTTYENFLRDPTIHLSGEDNEKLANLDECVKAIREQKQVTIDSQFDRAVSEIYSIQIPHQDYVPSFLNQRLAKQRSNVDNIWHERYGIFFPSKNANGIMDEEFFASGHTRIRSRSIPLNPGNNLSQRVSSLGIPPLPIDFGMLKSSMAMQIAASSSAATAAAAAAATPGQVNNATGSMPPQSSSSSSGFGKTSGWRPRKILLASLHDHTATVNRIVVSEDNLFFVSASDDCTAKIWLTSHLGREVLFKPIITYTSQTGRIKALCMIKNTHSFAIGTDEGNVQVIRVDRASIVDSVNDISQTSTRSPIGITRCFNISLEDEGSIVALDHFTTPTQSILVYATSIGKVHGYDVRVANEAWSLTITPQAGYITSIAVSPDGLWLVCGTIRGSIFLWDLRYQILISVWNHPFGFEISRLCISLATSDRPLALVAARNEVTLLNLEDGTRAQVYHIANEDQGTDEQMSKLCIPFLSFTLSSNENLSSNYDRFFLKIAENNQLYPGRDAQNGRILALLCPWDIPEIVGVARNQKKSSRYETSIPALITGGSDTIIRYWDAQEIKESYFVSTTSGLRSAVALGQVTSFGSSVNEANPKWKMIKIRTEVPSSKETKVPGRMFVCRSPPTVDSKMLQESSKFAPIADERGPMSANTQNFDAVFDLATVCLQDGTRLLLCATRDGLINIWR